MALDEVGPSSPSTVCISDTNTIHKELKITSLYYYKCLSCSIPVVLLSCTSESPRKLLKLKIPRPNPRPTWGGGGTMTSVILLKLPRLFHYAAKTENHCSQTFSIKGQTTNILGLSLSNYSFLPF